MKTGIRAGNSYKNYYKRYKDSAKWREAKLKRMETRLLVNENDKGAAQAIKVLNAKTHSRQKPGNKGWFPPQEIRFKKMAASSDPKVAEVGKNRLAYIRDVYADKRPSALKNAPKPNKQCSVVDQLADLGLINEKRREVSKSRLARIRTR